MAYGNEMAYMDDDPNYDNGMKPPASKPNGPGRGPTSNSGVPQMTQGATLRSGLSEQKDITSDDMSLTNKGRNQRPCQYRETVNPSGRPGRFICY